jgi:hypothetical protein
LHCVAQRRETSLSLSNVHFPSEVVGLDRIVANLAAASSIGQPCKAKRSLNLLAAKFDETERMRIIRLLNLDMKEV